MSLKAHTAFAALLLATSCHEATPSKPPGGAPPPPVDGPRATAPGKPTGVSAVPYVAAATVSWKAPSSNGGSALTGYVITPYVGTTAAAQVTVDGDATLTVVTGLTNGATYTFTVKAVNAVGTSDASDPSAPVTPKDLAPDIKYPAHPDYYMVGVAISELAPTDIGGAVSSYSVVPPLPAGLNLDAATGVVSGTPTAPADAADYVITATNSGGTATATLRLAVDPLSPDMIASGVTHTCALISGGMKCWGENTHGQLGDATAGDKHVPTPVKGMSSGVQAIAVGGDHTCAIVHGAAYCWGANDTGELGNSTRLDEISPIQVPGLSSGVTAIAAGYHYTCAIVNGGAKCWGYNGFGNLGNGTKTNSDVPVAVSGLSSGVTALSARAWHVCAIVNGGAKCWGDNDAGQLGDSTTVSGGVATPVNVYGLSSGVAALSAGDGFTCAVVAGGAKCWGHNSSGQLGDGTNQPKTTPLSVPGLSSGVQAISAGGSHTCAIVGGGAECWGWNGHGQLGDDSTTDRHSPTTVSGAGANVTGLMTGNQHSCALLSGEVKCWGLNDHGQLGDGSTTQRQVPVTVL